MGHELEILRTRRLDPSKQACLSPLLKVHLDIEPQASNVQYFGRMSTDKLYLLARQEEKQFELFLELHRRASIRWRGHGEVFEWDVEVGERLSEQAVKDEAYFLVRYDLLCEYDAHWNIGIKEDGSFILGPPVDLEKRPIPKATF